MYTVSTDSDFHGDSRFTSKSQTGVIGLLNCVPIHWRSNRQVKTSQSPVEAEVYALAAGVKDARSTYFVLNEMGARLQAEIEVSVDSTGAYSFFYDTCPDSKLSGCFDRKEKWVRELMDRVKHKVSWIYVADLCHGVLTIGERSGDLCHTLCHSINRIHEMRRLELWSAR